jgi:predicted NBD/HSP70 family sugar kinase
MAAGERISAPRPVRHATVLAALRGAGVLRVSELAARTGLSRPTVSRALEEMHEDGWIGWVDGHADARAGLGRPARLVRFRADAGHVVGIDIGPHRANVIVADLDGRQVMAAERATSSAHTGPELLAVVRATVRDALSDAHLSRDSVLSVVAGSPGIVDREAGVVVQAPGLPGWTALNLRRELQRSFGCPVQIENDVNLAVLGECAYGAAQDAATVAFVLWGERIGASICIDGRLHRGAANAAGEIGYLTVLDPALDEARPDSRGRGPFEQAVGAATIAELGRAAAVSGRRGRSSRVDARRAGEIFASAAQGNSAAAAVVDTVAARLARGLAPLLLVVDPELLVVGGGLSHAGPVLLDALARHLEPLTLVRTPVRLSELAENGVALGAVRLALADVERRVLAMP